MPEVQLALPAIIRLIEQGEYGAALLIVAVVMLFVVIHLLRKGFLSLSASAGINFRLGPPGSGGDDGKPAKRKGAE